MPGPACDLSQLSSIDDCIPSVWFQCTECGEDYGRKQPEDDSVLFRAYISLCFFRRYAKRGQFCRIQ